MTTPCLSPSAWLAAHHAAEAAIPRLIARGFIEQAAMLERRSRQFAERALGPADQAPQARSFPDIVEAEEP